MPRRPREIIDIDPELARQMIERPEGPPDFVIEDKTDGINLPPVDSQEAQDFIHVLNDAVQDLKQERSRDGTNGQHRR